MALRIAENQMMLTRPVDMTADRARDMRQTGLTAGTLKEIVTDTEDELRTVHERSEVEEAYVRTDDEGGNGGGGQEPPKRERKEAPPQDGDLQRRASERLTNLPVSRSRVTEERHFDIRV